MNMIHNQDFDIPAADAATSPAIRSPVASRPMKRSPPFGRRRIVRARLTSAGRFAIVVGVHAPRQSGAARNQLAALPDYILRDIGLPREIPPPWPVTGPTAPQ